MPRNTTPLASNQLTLFTKYLPCALQIRGEARSSVDVSKDGQFVCHSNAGCSHLLVHSIAFVCKSNAKSVFQAQRSTLIISKTSFTGCRSETDGGVVHAYDAADVAIQACNFSDIHSNGFGGALAVYGSNLSISYSWLYTCSSGNRGGAIWVSAFPDCFDSNLTQSTTLRISESQFSNCSTGGAGGQVLADSPTSAKEGETLIVLAKSTRFMSCTSNASGGAISASGAILLSLMHCTLEGNVAWGLGGGSLHLNRCKLGEYNTSVIYSRAPRGGGDAVFWQGSVGTGEIDCPAGTVFVEASCATALADPSACHSGTCVSCSSDGFHDSRCSSCSSDMFSSSACFACPPGKISSSPEDPDISACQLCAAGTYSDSQKSSRCSSCPSGSFSPYNGSSGCSACPKGTYSPDTGATECSSCPEGTYYSHRGANSSSACRLCRAGEYSGLSAAYCSACVSGTYTKVNYLSL